MLVEMGWVTSALTIQLYVTSDKGWWIVCGMLAAYILYFLHRLNTSSGLTFFLPLAMALGAIGGMKSDNMEDIWVPLHMALVALAVMGIFVAEYNRQEDTRFLGVIFVVLMPLAVWQSISRNNLWEEWAEGGRRGVNLQALFIMLAASYALLLKGRWKLLVVPLYGVLFILGSRTGFFTALAVPIIYGTINRTTRKDLLSAVPGLAAAALCLFAAVILYQRSLSVGGLTGDENIPSGLRVEGRYQSDELKESGLMRLEISRKWLEFLREQPTLFGNGCRWYTGRFGEEYYPHNGFLHVFNGYGVISGFLYSWVCISVILSLWKRRHGLAPHIVWAGAFFFSMILRKFGEAQLLVVPVHVAGFGIMYAVGLAIWGSGAYSGASTAMRRLKRAGPPEREYARSALR